MNVKQINIFDDNSGYKTRSICAMVTPDVADGELLVTSWTTTRTVVKMLEDEFTTPEIKGLCEDVIRACLKLVNAKVKQSPIYANRTQLDVRFSYRDDGSGVIDTSMYLPQPWDVSEPGDVIDLN